MIEWMNKEWFLLFILIPVFVGIYIYRMLKSKNAALIFSETSSLKDVPKSYKNYGAHLPFILSMISFALFTLALARPQIQQTTVEKNAEGIDIVLVLDTSTSMRATDLEPNRLEAARAVAKDFISKRLSDRIGLVAFARSSFTVCPPTLDYTLLDKLLGDVKMGMIDDGTAIGMGIATAVNRLEDSKAKSKIIILLTDGENNSGEIDPVTAADLAATYGIKIYTIGAGTRGEANYPVDDPVLGRRYVKVKVNIDEDMLTKIANMTKGKYFRATNTTELESIYKDIDQLERSKIEEIIYTDSTDLYPRFAIPAVLILLLVPLLDKLVFRTELV